MIISSPALSVSQDGATVAAALGTDVTMVTAATGERLTLRAMTSASLVALAPHGEHDAAVAAEGEVSWLSADATTDTVGTATLPGRVMFARQPVGGTVIALTRSDSKGSFITALGGRDLVPLIEPIPLGHSSAHVFEVDSDNSVIVAGVRGKKAWDGVGDRYLCRISWADGAASVAWNGEGLPVEVSRVRARLGSLVAGHDGAIITSTINSLQQHGSIDGEVTDVGGDVEDLAISPDGATLCALVRSDDGLHVVSGGLGDARLADRGIVPPGLDAVALAVGDDAHLTVAGLRSATEVAVALANPGEGLAERWRMDFPRSVFRED